MMVLFGVPRILQHRVFKAPKGDHNFNNHPIQAIGAKGGGAKAAR